MCTKILLIASKTIFGGNFTTRVLETLGGVAYSSDRAIYKSFTYTFDQFMIVSQYKVFFFTYSSSLQVVNCVLCHTYSSGSSSSTTAQQPVTSDDQPELFERIEASKLQEAVSNASAMGQLQASVYYK